MYVIGQFDNQGEIQLRTCVIVFLKTFKKQYSHKKLVGVNFLHRLRPLSLLSPFSNSYISARKPHSQAGLATTSGKLKTKRVQGVIMLFKIHYSEFGWHTMRRPMSLTIKKSSTKYWALMAMHRAQEWIDWEGQIPRHSVSLLPHFALTRIHMYITMFIRIFAFVYLYNWVFVCIHLWICVYLWIGGFVHLYLHSVFTHSLGLPDLATQVNTERLFTIAYQMPLCHKGRLKKNGKMWEFFLSRGPPLPPVWEFYPDFTVYFW